MNQDHTHIDRLTKSIRKGDTKSFQLLYDLLSDSIFRYAYSFVLSHEEAEEIMHDVFLRIWDKRETLLPDKSLYYFMFTITKNLTLDRVRQYTLEHSKLKNYFHESHEQFHHSVEQKYIYKELDQTINDIVQAMPARRKAVYLLSRQKGMTNREISEYLNITTIAVEKHIRLALSTLRSELHKRKWPVLLHLLILIYALIH